MSDPRSPVSGVIGILGGAHRVRVNRDKERLDRIDEELRGLRAGGKGNSERARALRDEHRRICEAYD